MHLGSLTISRFRSCDNVTISLRSDLTVLVGENMDPSAFLARRDFRPHSLDFVSLGFWRAPLGRGAGST